MARIESTKCSLLLLSPITGIDSIIDDGAGGEVALVERGVGGFVAGHLSVELVGEEGEEDFDFLGEEFGLGGFVDDDGSRLGGGCFVGGEEGLDFGDVGRKDA